MRRRRATRDASDAIAFSIGKKGHILFGTRCARDDLAARGAPPRRSAAGGAAADAGTFFCKMVDIPKMRD
jgi:hypothetical protein